MCSLSFSITYKVYDFLIKFQRRLLKIWLRAPGSTHHLSPIDLERVVYYFECVLFFKYLLYPAFYGLLESIYGMCVDENNRNAQSVCNNEFFLVLHSCSFLFCSHFLVFVLLNDCLIVLASLDFQLHLIQLCYMYQSI